MISATDSPTDALLVNPEFRTIFERYGILASSEKGTIESHAKTLGLNADFVVQLANSSFNAETASHKEFEQYDIPVLVDYLKRSHEYYLQKRLPEIGQTIHAMRRKFVKEDPVYILLSGFFVSYRKELEAHFQYEEEHLFPYAKLLHGSKGSWRVLPSLKRFLGMYSVQEFLDNHSDTEAELQTVRKALLLYKAPKDSELPYQVLLKQLSSFEQDMHLHALIEDHVLVPKLAMLETEISEN